MKKCQIRWLRTLLFRSCVQRDEPAAIAPEGPCGGLFGYSISSQHPELVAVFVLMSQFFSKMCRQIVDRYSGGW